MFNSLVSGITAIVLSISSFFGINVPANAPIQNEPTIAGDAVLPIAGATYTLSGGGISSTATSITLSTLTIPQTGQELIDSDFSDTFYVTLEPGNRSRQELVSCTTVTQNAGDTATLSGCSRGLSPITPFTASSTLRFSHSGGTSVIFSDPPQLFNQFAAKDNDESISGQWIFSDLPETNTSLTATTSNQFTTKQYVDNVANTGAATSTETNGGILELGTLAEQADSFDGGANKPTALQTKNSTSTCQIVGSYNIVASSTTGKLDKGCFDQTANYTWTGNQLLSGAASSTQFGILNTLYVGTTASSTLQGNSTGTSTLQGFLNVSGTNSTSTFSGNLAIANNATTTNLVISGIQTGGAGTYTASTTAFSVSSGTTNYASNIPTKANWGILQYTITDGTDTVQNNVYIARTGLTAVQIGHVQQTITQDGVYTFSWSGATLSVTEDTDDSADSSIAGTAYWYQ